MLKLINKIFYRFYGWRGPKDKLDDSFIWVLAGLVVYSILSNLLKDVWTTNMHIASDIIKSS